jgi:molybdopterin-containing oxidoreductase family iron-sulfur binding subunit
VSSVEDRTTNGKAYWRSLDELADTPEFQELLEKEFAHALPDEAEASDPVTRRRFLQLMGASLALGGMAGCKGSPVWPVKKILPYAHRPEDRIPGKPLEYATMLEIGGVARALVAKSMDGRPIKIEGNREHPASKGAADVWSQACVLSLYDPDRSRGIVRRSGGEALARAWDAFFDETRSAFDAQEGGAGVAILAEASSSPTLLEARARLTEKLPQARWVEWESVSRDAAREATKSLFGSPLRPQLLLENADVVVSLDDDFLGAHPASLAWSRAFAARRRAEDGAMIRLHVIEPAWSITGSMADHRVALPASRIARAAWCLAARLVEGGAALPASMEYLRSTIAKAPHAVDDLAFVEPLAKDLLAHRGRALVTAGPGQPASVHALAIVLTAALGGLGTTMSFTPEIDPVRAGHAQALRALVDSMNGGAVRSLLILGGNPVYDAPADLGFAAALAKVPVSIHLSLHDDETSRACTWHLPRAHALESWGDARSWDGTITIAQPLIEPLFGGRTPAEIVDSIAEGRPARGLDLVRRTWETRFAGTPSESGWRRVVHDGFVAGSAWPQSAPGFESSSWIAREEDMHAPAAGTELVFLPDASVYDGRFANSGWLQEFPDPMTKLTWDNAALMSPATAKTWGVTQGNRIRVSRNGRSLELPVYLVPGQAEDTIAVALGYGRSGAGRLGDGIGVDVSLLRTTDALHFAAGVEVAKTGGKHKFASTQNHHAIFNAQQGHGEAQRLPELFREGTLAEYREHPDFAAHRSHVPPLVSLFGDHAYDQGRKWGMSIDLTACNGCGACVIACQAENNVAIVGKDEVSRGREMHWIRIDRYFHGPDEAPAARHQPVTCHQCENAPCEQVCPVAATTHSSEGLNDMAYNRCVGTRYCSNNCPYKVRRFNYFNNQTGSLELRKKRKEGVSALEAMVYNPEVTVRARGVMEKCTYCVQRIKAVTIPAKNEGRPVKDGEIVPACAQTCPTEAITFGDLNDPESRVRKLHDHPRSYAMLAELNVRPRTRYLAKLTNPAGNGAAADHGGPGHDSPATHGTHGA